MDSVVQQNLRSAVQFQPYCKHCLLVPTDNGNCEYHPFLPCEDCKLALFCSDDCRSAAICRHRQTGCADFQDLAVYEIFRLHYLRETGEPELILPFMHPRSRYVLLKTIRSWKQYFDEISGLPLGQDINDAFQPFLDGPKGLHNCRVAKFATDASTIPLMILAGLESEIANFSTRRRLTIHVVGADDTELGVMRLNEDLLHLLPNLKDLVIGYIGPDFPCEGEGADSLINHGGCPDCSPADRTRQIFIQRKLYHDFKIWRLSSQYPPDLIVVFNSRHADAEVNSWEPTLKSILDMGVPAVFTTYNKTEAVEEEVVLERLGVHFSKRMLENPWRGFLPFFDVRQERYEPFFHNHYWYIIKGKAVKA